MKRFLRATRSYSRQRLQTLFASAELALQRAPSNRSPVQDPRDSRDFDFFIYRGVVESAGGIFGSIPAASGSPSFCSPSAPESCVRWEALVTSIP